MFLLQQCSQCLIHTHCKAPGSSQLRNKSNDCKAVFDARPLPFGWAVSASTVSWCEFFNWHSRVHFVVNYSCPIYDCIYVLLIVEITSGIPSNFNVHFQQADNKMCNESQHSWSHHQHRDTPCILLLCLLGADIYILRNGKSYLNYDFNIMQK